MYKSILIGNGFNINFGGAAYTNQFIIKKQMGFSMGKVVLDRGYDTGVVHKGLELL